MSEIYDITIVGGGPVGLFAAFYGNMRQVKVKLIDSLPQLGGQPAILYPEKNILDVPGFTNLTGEELSDRLIEQVKRFDTPIFLNETVENIQKEVTSSLLLLLAKYINLNQSSLLWVAVPLNHVLLISRGLIPLITSTITYQTSNNMKDNR